MHDEMWSALYMYNRQILSYMAKQESLTRVEKLLLKTADEFLWLLESVADEKTPRKKLTVLQGGRG